MNWEYYKPKYHKQDWRCTDNCELDCNMECQICRASPAETKYYFIVKGENDSIQVCEKCQKELTKLLVELSKQGAK